jgi:hypothetical protein
VGKNSNVGIMVMDARQYTSEDFDMVHSWWKKHHNNEFRPDYPPKYSYIVHSGGEALGFFGMAPMTPAFCYLSFPLVNPDAPKELRDEAVDFIIESSKIWASKCEFPIVWISIRGEKMLNRLGKAGFIEAETGNSHMFCKVGEIA